VLKYRPHNQIDKQKWDACVEASAQRIVYALSWYLDVVAPAWVAFIWEQEEQYKAVMPLPEAHKFGIKYVLQPFFCPQLGVFATTEIFLDDFVQALKEKYVLISNYCFNTANYGNVNKVSDLKVKQYYTHHLQLNAGYGQIFAGYSRDRKLNLKRARKAGLTIVESTDIKPIIKLFREDAEARIYGGVNLETYLLLERLYKELQQRGLATLLYTHTPDGEIDAGCLFINYADKIIYIFNAASKSGRRHNGRSLMIDAVIRKYAGQPLVFDFESPPDVANIIRVYQGFGSEPVPYYSLQLNRLPKPLQFIKEARRFFYQRVLPAFRSSPQA